MLYKSHIYHTASSASGQDKPKSCAVITKQLHSAYNVYKFSYFKFLLFQTQTHDAFPLDVPKLSFLVFYYKLFWTCMGQKLLQVNCLKRFQDENTFHNKTLSVTVTLVYFIFGAVAQKMCNIFSKIQIFKYNYTSLLQNG